MGEPQCDCKRTDGSHLRRCSVVTGSLTETVWWPDVRVKELEATLRTEADAWDLAATYARHDWHLKDMEERARKLRALAGDERPHPSSLMGAVERAGKGDKADE